MTHYIKEEFYETRDELQSELGPSFVVVAIMPHNGEYSELLVIGSYDDLVREFTELLPLDEVILFKARIHEF